jgi:L-ascorbate metabolism protein UlaG (beta-lactamase superfamily)
VLPIGDNFTMGPDDALRAVKLINAIIPVHYDTWELIAQDPGMGQASRISTGQRLVIPAGRSRPSDFEF